MSVIEFASRPAAIATKSKPKVESVEDLYHQERWPKQPFKLIPAPSGIDDQPTRRLYTEHGLRTRLEGASAEMMEEHPNGVVYAGENGEWQVEGAKHYDIGALGVQTLGEYPETSVAYTGTSAIPDWWYEWVNAESGREYGLLIQKLAEQLLGMDPEKISKDPMGFRSMWKLREFNRRTLYTDTFRACVAPIINKELYASPPENLSREEMNQRLNEVRAYVARQQRVPTAPVDRSKYLFVMGSDNLAKFDGTYGALSILQRRKVLPRIAHAHMFPTQRTVRRDFQLVAQPVSLSQEADQPGNAQLIVDYAKQRAIQALHRNPQALASIGEQGGIIEIGNGYFEAHYVHALNSEGLEGGEWTVFFPLPQWFVHQIGEYQTQASHLAMVYGGLGADPISLFSRGLQYNRPQTLQLATMGALLPHAYPELHSPHPFVLG